MIGIVAYSIWARIRATLGLFVLRANGFQKNYTKMSWNIETIVQNNLETINNHNLWVNFLNVFFLIDMNEDYTKKLFQNTYFG